MLVDRFAKDDKVLGDILICATLAKSFKHPRGRIRFDKVLEPTKSSG
jgi:hypothetical protein